MAGKKLLILAGGGGGTGAGVGGGVVAEEAPPVTIGRPPDPAATVREIYNGDFEIDVYWSPNAAATPSNFRGVAVYVEDPDISSGQEAPLDNTQNLDGTSQMSGKWQPKREDDSYESPAVLIVPGERGADRDVRVYLLAFGPAANGNLVRANDTTATPTPNIVVSVPQMADKYISGQEHAWNITNPQVIQTDKFDDPAGPVYSLTYNYTKPDPATPLPPGMEPFGGVEIWFQYDPNDPSTQTDSGVSLPVDEPGPWTSPDYPAVGTGTFQVYFVSMDIDHNMNTIVTGVTPEIDVTVVYPPVGEASAPDVTGFALSNQRYESTFDGSILDKIDADWTIPDSPRYAGMTIYVVSPISAFRLLLNATEPMAHATLQVIDYPTTPQDWTLAAISVDFDGHAAADPHTLPLPLHIPTAVWHNVGPPGVGGYGGEYASLAGVTGVQITTEQQLNSDGVVMMRHKIVGWVNPTDNGFGGISIARVVQGDPNPAASATWWDAQKTDTSLTTPWEPAPGPRSWDFYFVSRNQQNKRNSMVPGFTPVVHVLNFAPIQGQIVASRVPKDWWDPTEFQWPTYPDGYFQALSFIAKKIYVGSILRVGGGTGANDATFGAQSNGQIAVYSSTNVLRGWIGEQDKTATPDQPSQHSIFGAWFAELYLGGDGPPSAPIYAKQDGTVIVGGWDVQGTRYPYISIRDKYAVEVGRIGANVGINLVGSTDQAYIQGAWFRDFAFGGQGLADWRFLAKYDATSGIANVQMRNVNKFWIDYAANYNLPGTSNPYNAANHLEFGYDTFVADSGSSNYYKFPGLSLYRSFTQHGINLINRGLVLKNAGGLRVGALVSFNGDSQGGDTANGGLFWGTLTLNNPNTGVPTITLASGGPNGGVQPSIFMTDAPATTTYFAADTVNAVTCRLGVTTGVGLVIDSSNNIMGAAIHSSAGYNIGGTGPAYSGTPVIDSGGNFVGRGVSMGSGGTINTYDDVHARNYYAGYPSPNVLVINSQGQFVGPLAPSSLTVSGAVTAGSITCNGAYSATGSSASITFTNSGTALQLAASTGGIYARGQIQSDGGYTANISGWGFATGGSEDVVVGGVTLHFRGGIYAGHS
jgi:hypothetical protein